VMIIANQQTVQIVVVVNGFHIVMVHFQWEKHFGFAVILHSYINNDFYVFVFKYLFIKKLVYFYNFKVIL